MSIIHLQVEVAFSVLSNVLTYYSTGDSVQLVAGVRNNTLNYWVGTTSVTIADNGTVENPDQVVSTQLINFTFILPADVYFHCIC